MDKEDAVRMLIREQAKLLAYLYSIVREVSQAEDLFQKVVVLGMQKHEEIENVPHLLLWARQAARFETPAKSCWHPTELDGELSRRAEQALIRRIAESEVEESSLT